MSATVFPVHLDGKNQELETHSVWHLGMATGVLLPDCGIYYLEQQTAVIGPKQRAAIASSLAGYAVCVVRLEAMV